tara:strand:- start:53 stop:313 length:261 start_codon:yes stop_codon:yes gene_type:complete
MENKNMTTKFPRAHQFNKLDAYDQHEFAKSMVKMWDDVRKEIEQDALKTDLAFLDPKEFSYKAKPAYTQTRNFFVWNPDYLDFRNK